MNYPSTNEISQKIMILWGVAFIFSAIVYIYTALEKINAPPKIMIFRQISSLLLKLEFSLIFPRYRGKISRGIQIFYQNFCNSSLLSLFAARLYAKKCKTSVCTRQPELPPVHASDARMG